MVNARRSGTGLLGAIEIKCVNSSLYLTSATIDLSSLHFVNGSTPSNDVIKSTAKVLSEMSRRRHGLDLERFLFFEVDESNVAFSALALS
jgi:hypothetical protein